MNVILALIFSAVAAGCGSALGKNGLRTKSSALLLGLFLGFGAAAATGNENIVRYSCLIAAFGAVGAFAVQDLNCKATAKLILLKRSPALGVFGLGVKGFLQTAIPAGFISVGIMSLGMVSYTLADVVLLFCFILLSRPLGTVIFNRGKNSLRFSSDSTESWGRELLLYAALACVFLVKGDLFSLTLSAVGGLLGLMGEFAALPLRARDKKDDFLPSLVSGAAGGIGVSLGTLAADRLFPEILASEGFASNAKFSSYVPQGVSLVFALTWCALWVSFFFLSRSALSRRKTLLLLLSDGVFCALPFLFLSLGSYHTACFASIPLALFLLAEAHTPAKRTKRKLFPVILLWVCFAASVASVSILTTAVPRFICAFAPLFLHIFDFCVSERGKKNKHRIFVYVMFPALAVLSALLWFLVL